MDNTKVGQELITGLHNDDQNTFHVAITATADKLTQFLAKTKGKSLESTDEFRSKNGSILIASIASVLGPLALKKVLGIEKKGTVETTPWILGSMGIPCLPNGENCGYEKRIKGGQCYNEMGNSHYRKIGVVKHGNKMRPIIVDTKPIQTYLKPYRAAYKAEQQRNQKIDMKKTC